MRIYPVLFWAVVVLAGCVAKPEETAAVVAPVSEKREIEKVAPEVAAKRVAEGTAVLVDVREPSEWHESGVAAPAYLLPMSDLQRNREEWGALLEGVGDRQILLYCRSGNRAGMVAEILAEEGFDVGNVGGFRDWQAAGLPGREMEAPRTEF